jgi:chemotaxis protein MotB
MADKKPIIVIKKITIVAGGGHGGAWKVAFADFMTAMMAFFLVMWLMAQSSEAEKKAVSDYFSTPSVIEYQFQNLGVELTLEKLFLDMINEPLKTLASFVEPMDRTPNVMGMGMKKVAMAFAADQLGAAASSVNVTADTLTFEIPDHLLFEKNSAQPGPGFVAIMERVKGIVSGLEDSEIAITSLVYRSGAGKEAPFPKNAPETTETENHEGLEVYKQLAEQRLDLIKTKVRMSLEHESVDMKGRAIAKDDDRVGHDNRAGNGLIRFEIKQKSTLPDGKKPKPLKDNVFGNADADKSVYDNFVKQVSNSNKSKSAKKRKPAAREE